MLQKVWWLVVFLCVVALAHAQQAEFIVHLSPQQETVKTNETAVFEITVINLASAGYVFEVFSPDISWDVRTSKPLFAEGKNEVHGQLLIHALNVNPGLYGVPISVRKVGTGEIVKQTVFVELQSTNPPTSTYLPAFKGNASMPKQVEPGADITIAVQLENLNRRNLSDVNIKIRSNVVNKDYTTNLEPREKKVVSFTTKVDASAVPQKDVLRIYLIKTENERSYQYELKPLQYELIGKANIVVQEVHEEFWFKYVDRVVLTNAGNLAKDGVYTREMTLFRRLFTSIDPDAEVKDGAYHWMIPLDIGEERTVTIVTNYQPPIILVVLIMLGTLAYFVFRSPLGVRKTALIMSTKEGGISEMKIRIQVRNRSRKVLHNIEVIDLVPKIADVDKTFDGTLKAPAKIVKHEKKGTLLKWQLDHLDPGEEYILQYRMISKFSIIGGATLPVTVGKFSDSAGKERTTFSNRFRVKTVQ